MGLSAPWADSLEIIAYQPVKIFWGLIQWALVPLVTMFFFGYYNEFTVV